MPLGESELQEVDQIFDAYFQTGATPGLVYGVADGDQLIHSRTIGMSEIGSRTPTSRTTFRVASITKSFTAASAILLRDRGVLDLETPISRYLPELKNLKMPFQDAPEIQARMLLSMSAGFPTDDPWADRLEQATDAEFGAILEGGIRFDSVPGVRFEYSNLGYAMLARIIARVTGIPFIDFVPREFLQPLALNSTTFDFRNAMDLAVGYAKRGEWQSEVFSEPGAFSAIGGLITNLDDLVAWSGYLSEAFDLGVAERGPLCKASRREMQQVHRFIPEAVDPGVEPAHAGSMGYGFGLMVEHDRNFGKIVGHSGGYPGYGSHMRWHTESRISVIALANGRYAGPFKPCTTALRSLLVTVEPNQVEPSSESLVFQGEVNRLISHWDDDIADRIFAFNMDLDHPRAYRLEQIQVAIAQIGGLKKELEVFAEMSKDSSHRSWKIAGNKGTLSVEIRLAPNLPPRLQSWRVTVGEI
ncbi:MAG TPA: serine hydrolase domain-containing protein [Candidatus Nanopelagicaceae bacterium]|nr:serine hydrolase domain-containing protein [Candidatus Nanopelagicaceae bacterium]